LLLLYIKQKSVIKIFINNNFFVYIFGLVTLIFTNISAIDANRYIIEFTKLEPNLFPNGQYFLTFLILPVYFIMFLYIIYIVLTFIYSFTYSNGLIKTRNRYRQQNMSLIQIGIFNGLITTIVLVIPFIMNILFSEVYKKNVIEKVFILLSYYQNNKICTNHENNISLAFLQNNKISIITRDLDENILYKIGICKNDYFAVN